MRGLAKAAFFAAALPAVARASWRCARLARRLPLDELVERLRATPRFAVAALARPEWLLATVDRLLPILPPLRHGRCLKRSLLLLDLWSRCGLHARLHLGVRREEDDGRHQGHAWVTVGTTGVAPAAAARRATTREVRAIATSSQGYPEAFVL